MPKHLHHKRNSLEADIVGERDRHARPAGWRRFELYVGLVLATSIIGFLLAASNHFIPASICIVLLFLIPIAVQVWGLTSLLKRFEDHKERSACSNFYLATQFACVLPGCVF